MATATYESKRIIKDYKESLQILETIRIESKKARGVLIEKIKCDQRDILSKKEIDEINQALAQFLKVQRMLMKAWLRIVNTSARFKSGIRYYQIKNPKTDCR